MPHFSERYLKTGGDPRSLPDYAALRDELSKLTHPARPDVNWHYAEKRCLALFEHNGVELQSTAWYTLIRTQLAGLDGLNEGLSILEALIHHQWERLWPQPVAARMEILSSLSQRIQQMMRTLPLKSSDLSQLYRAEQLLSQMGIVLQRLALKHISQFDTLCTLMHNSAVRLENSDDTSHSDIAMQSDILQPASTRVTETLSGITAIAENAPNNRVNWVYVAQPNVTVISAPIKKWQPFVAGMGIMLMLSIAVVWGWLYQSRPDPLQIQLTASLAPLPTILTPGERDTLRQQSLLPQTVITQTQQQLARLDQLPAGWNIHYGRQLVEQARSLWPEQAQPLVQQWQQQLNAVNIPTENLHGWSLGMTTLQQLADRLNSLDEKRGKYITVSELKSAVFDMLTHFHQTVPAEEQLRIIQLQPDGSPARQQKIQEIEQHLRAQIHMLMQDKARVARSL